MSEGSGIVRPVVSWYTRKCQHDIAGNQPPMYVLAITGSIGSGKSSATRYLEQRGASVLDADHIAREVVLPGSPLLEELVSQFGDDIVDKTGALDRSVLAQRVFNNKAELERLNSIMIPAIYQELVRQLNEVKSSIAACKQAESYGDPAVEFARGLIVIEIALLAENPQFGSVADEIMVIETSHDAKIERLLERGMTLQDIKSRLAVQASDEARRDLAGTVIVNDGTYQDLCAQLDDWLMKKVQDEGAQHHHIQGNGASRSGGSQAHQGCE